MNEKLVKEIMNWETRHISVDELIESYESAESFAESVDQAWMLLANASRIYKEKEDAVMKAETLLSELKLSEAESVVITDHANAEESLNVTITELAYLAGFNDCIKALKNQGLLRTEEV